MSRFLAMICGCKVVSTLTGDMSGGTLLGKPNVWSHEADRKITTRVTVAPCVMVLNKSCCSSFPGSSLSFRYDDSIICLKLDKSSSQAGSGLWLWFAIQMQAVSLLIHLSTCSSVLFRRKAQPFVFTVPATFKSPCYCDCQIGVYFFLQQPTSLMGHH